MIGGQGLLIEHIDSGPSDRVALESMKKVGLDHDWAAGGIHQKRRRLHERELSLTDEPARSPAEHEMNGGPWSKSTQKGAKVESEARKASACRVKDW
jgi:hypothetical protein